MDYLKIIQDLIGQFDLSLETQRRLAYARCEEYADEHLAASENWNRFLERAAKILRVPPTRKDVAREAVAQVGDEKLHLAYSPEAGPTLVGNASGLIYLSKVLHNIASSRSSGEHSHFYYGQWPLVGTSFPLTVSLENEKWFVEHSGNNDPDSEDDSQQVPERDVPEEHVIAFQICGPAPPNLLVTPYKVYRILSVAEYNEQNEWIKGIRESTHRVRMFSFLDDAGKQRTLGLDLDDQQVVFLRKEHLEQFDAGSG
ncbi:MAG: hypothetical protein JSU94_15720 [Phycisphaerales bacterium]|nr:MAG: hypothetical protein JSU94_15720 [Phycisphaerales bacterium]